jgi:uncharacterized protein
MSHAAHELHEEFPDQAERLHHLKTHDAHFAKLAEIYHTVNRSIHRAESGVEALADAALEDLKKQRLTLKDQIAGMLQAA